MFQAIQRFRTKTFLTWIVGFNQHFLTQKFIIFFVVFICLTRSACLTFCNVNVLLFHVLLRTISLFSYLLRCRWITFFLSRNDMYDAIHLMHENINMKEFSRWHRLVFSRFLDFEISGLLKKNFMATNGLWAWQQDVRCLLIVTCSGSST